MKREYNELLSAWCDEEIAVLKQKGAIGDFPTEPAFANSVLRNVLAKHQDEVRADNNLAKAVLMVWFENASLSDLRHLAAKGGKKKKKITGWPTFLKCAQTTVREARFKRSALS